MKGDVVYAGKSSAGSADKFGRYNRMPVEEIGWRRLEEDVSVIRQYRWTCDRGSERMKTGLD